MNKQLREVTKADLIPAEEYAKNRKAYRKEIVSYKKDRRVSLGPYANFYFESYETMKAQIQEMLHIEKGGNDQLKDELAAYNPLIPKGKELVATLMFEIDNPLSRTEFLNKVGRPTARQVDNKKNKYMASDCPLAGKHLNQLSKDTDIKHDEALHPIEIMAKAYKL